MLFYDLWAGAGQYVVVGTGTTDQRFQWDVLTDEERARIDAERDEELVIDADDDTSEPLGDEYEDE